MKKKKYRLNFQFEVFHFEQFGIYKFLSRVLSKNNQLHGEAIAYVDVQQKTNETENPQQ